MLHEYFDRSAFSVKFARTRVGAYEIQHPIALAATRLVENNRQEIPRAVQRHLVKLYDPGSKIAEDKKRPSVAGDSGEEVQPPLAAD